jgi:predicted metal-binding membrane protein
VIYSARSMAGGMALPGGAKVSMIWLRMPGQTWAGAAAAFLAMWLVMMVAMMVPPLVPLLATLRHRGLAALAGTGYYAVWALFGAGVYVAGAWIVAAELRWPAIARDAPLATGVALLGAGCFQFTAWKAAWLARCRACAAPATPDAASAFQRGVHFGTQCTLCCAGLMVVLLVAGMMRLTVIALVAAAIAVERLAPHPERTARAIGLVVSGMGVLVIVRAIMGR